jgi:hypothetical protein
MKCPNGCRTEMQLVGPQACRRWHCMTCYYWKPTADSSAKNKSDWKAEMQLAAKVFLLGGACRRAEALRKEGFL